MCSRFPCLSGLADELGEDRRHARAAVVVGRASAELVALLER